MTNLDENWNQIQKNMKLRNRFITSNPYCSPEKTHGINPYGQNWSKYMNHSSEIKQPKKKLINPNLKQNLNKSIKLSENRKDLSFENIEKPRKDVQKSKLSNLMNIRHALNNNKRRIEHQTHLAPEIVISRNKLSASGVKTDFEVRSQSLNKRLTLKKMNNKLPSIKM